MSPVFPNVMAAAVGVAHPAHGRRTSRGALAAWRRLSPTGREKRAAPSPPPSDRHFREGEKPETVETDSRFRGNDGSICRGACFRESGGMPESWRAGPFAFHPPPGLPPVRGEEKRRRGEVRAAFPLVRGEKCNRRWRSLADKQEAICTPPPGRGRSLSCADLAARTPGAAVARRPALWHGPPSAPP